MKGKTVAQSSLPQNERGFTLIEVLIVIIVLGILATIVVLGVGSTKKTASAAACKTAVKSVELSAAVYKGRTGHYPDTQADVHGDDALLKSWPASDDYGLAYVPVGYSPGPPVAHASGFAVTVLDGDGDPIASCSDL